MFGVIKKMFIAEMWFIELNVRNAFPLKCVSMSDQESKNGYNEY